MHILLLEDEEAISRALSRSMRRWGHDVVVADSLAEARKLVRDKAPDAFVSDLKLPDGKGTEMAAELGVPFVVMSGYASFDDAVDVLRLGGVDFLTKPVALDSLKTALSRMTVRRESSDLWVVDPSVEGRIGRVMADTIQEEGFYAQEMTWNSREQAEVCFQQAGTVCACVEHRQIVAELLQAVDSGHLVINRGGGFWRAWLSASVPWQDSSQADRRQVIEGLAHRCLARDNGIMVECQYG